MSRPCLNLVLLTAPTQESFNAVAALLLMRVLSLSGRETAPTSLGISQPKLSTSHSRITSKDFLEETKQEMDISCGS